MAGAEAAKQHLEELRDAAPPVPETPKPAEPPPAAQAAAVPRMETVRRVNTQRFRSGSILGLDIGRPETETEKPSSEPPASES